MDKRFLLASVAISLLAACGGGGGGGGGGGSTFAPPTRPEPPTQPEPPGPPGPPGPTLTASDPAYHLGTARFATHQPDVLERIGAHHAYARDLTGRGVRIGIEDSIVDYTQRAEFGNRVRLDHADGAVLFYPHYLGAISGSDIATCRRERTCRASRGNSEGDPAARNRWVQRFVSENNWPTRDNSVFIADEHYPTSGGLEGLNRWMEVPTPYGEGAHGTAVASVAAGTNLGVAPEATIIPVAVDFAARQQQENDFTDTLLRSAIASLPSADRSEVDDALADTYREDYAKFDIVNRSYGIDLFDPEVVSAEIDTELEWYRSFLPETLDAVLQVGTPDSRKTILVYAAGNEGQPWSGLGADLPYYIPELRGHSLSVVGTDPQTGAIADYSNRCGPVPTDWNAALHGQHYCLAAPGTVRGLVPDASTPGQGRTTGGLLGTSFAAPLVSGSLALLKEHFRGTRGNTQIVKRMLDTADRTGRYADLETYGAGHLDLEAALSPAGPLNAGQSAHALSRTTLRTPAAFGSVAQRAGNIELAAFDDQDFPFWVPLSVLIAARTADRSPIPRFEDVREPAVPAPGLDALDLRWTDMGGGESVRFPGERRWAMGFGPTSASLARRPPDDGWGYGLSLDDGGHLGTEASGAFGTDLRSGVVWTSRAFEHRFGGGWTLNATGTVALSLPKYGKDAMFRATPSMLSAMSMRVGTGTTGVVVEQPLRAESGTGRFRIENGRIENGSRLHDEFRVPLRPDAREVRMTLRHDFTALSGTVALEVGGAVNAGHVPAEREAKAGLAYRAAW